MILYFADRKMNILGQASTSLPEGVIISNDRKTEEVDEGVAILEFDLEYDPEWRKKAETWTEAGNYILRKDGDDREFYTIISREKDPVNGSVNDIYAEDAGLDLLNEVVGAYKADKAYSAEFYIKKFSYDSGFEVGVNEVSNLTRKLSWDGEATATERLLSVATQFDNAEISFSFDVDRMSVVHKYINIFKRRGVDSGVQLQIGREIKKIRIKDTIEDLATAYVCTGGIPDGKDDPITLAGYKYDDGDFYVEGTHLNSRKALQKWSRYQIKTEMGDNVGHIVKTFSYDTTSQSELCNRAVSSLKKICDVNTTYEIELSYLPRGTKIGDTVYIIDHTGELYLSSRLLKIETSVCDNTKTAELGEYSVKSSGVSEKLRELADAFAKVAQNRKFYTWIAYADDDIGTGASLDSYGKEYLGIASNRVTRDPDLTDPTVYTWIKIRGEQGMPGTSGKDGKTSYFHVKYSDVEKPASYSDMTETPAKYIGTYVDYELEDSKDPSKYTWSKFQGEDGTDGIPGKNGENGETSYVHFAYATSEDGKTSFSTTDPTDKTYIGQYVDFKKVDSEQPEKYRWSKFQGPKGPAGSDGEQGYGIVASVTRENFTEDQWNSTYGMTGHLTSWTGTSTLRNGCRIGDIFVVVGTATDTKNAHTAYYRSDTDAGDLQGICIGHTIAFRGSAGIDGTDGKGIESIKEHYAVSTSNTVTPTVWFDDVPVTNPVNKYLWNYETITYTNGTSADSKKRVIGVYGDTGKDGAKGDGLDIKDTRTTNESPNWYIKNYPKTTVMEFKECQVIGLSNAGTYCNLQTIVLWSDNTVGYPRQTAKIEGTGKEYWRVGTSDTTWSSWIDPYGKSLEAAKTATNFMEFNSGTGLQIGDKTNGSWKGFRSRITSTAFEILNEAGTAVASYGRKLIQLGKDSVDAVIELCGGKGSIKHENVGVYGETKSTLTVNGVNLGLLADDSVIIRSEQVDGDNTTYTSQIYMTKGRIDIATFTELEDGTVTGSNGVDIDDNVGIDIGVPGETETALSKARINGRSLLDFLHPVGSIYMSTSATNPTNLFGGTWVAWGAGRVPVGFNGGDGNFNSSEKTGGSKTINIQHNHGLSNARAAVGRADSSTSTISYTAGGNPHNVYFDREFSYWGGIAGVSKHATDTAKIYGNTNNGGSTSASVLQPYITCYMWKRTA